MFGEVHKSKPTLLYFVFDRGPYVTFAMFTMLSGPSIAAISVAFYNIEQMDIYLISDQ